MKIIIQLYSVELVMAELAENDFDGNRSIVQVWMKKIPEHKYFLVRRISCIGACCSDIFLFIHLLVLWLVQASCKVVRIGGE